MINNLYNDIITIDELCEILNIGRNTAYKLLASNELGAFKIGNNWKIPYDSVTQYVLNKSRIQT